MKEKNKFKIKDKKFKLFIPLVNLLLFETLNSPDFDSENKNLSKNFIEILNSIEQIDFGENEFFRTRILHFLSGLDIKSRGEIYKIIVENEIYMHAMTISYTFENNRIMNSSSITLTQEKIFLELVSFRLEGNLSKVILFYFIFHFEDIVCFKFSEKKNISKIEYHNIIESLCREKCFLSKNFF